MKNGSRLGKQCHLCKICGRQFTGEHELIENEKRTALVLGCLRLSSRKIGNLMGYSHVTILKWFKSNAEKFSNIDDDISRNIRIGFASFENCQ